ncbi:TraI domain-containing protein [Enterobacter hormaechei]|uniref:TraI domain-containing protein n=1 Tax=Enterobacter hormaechei TaxID=158836 RepID=UPI0032DAAE4B
MVPSSMYNLLKKLACSSFTVTTSKPHLVQGYHMPHSGEVLLSSPERQRCLQILWESSVLPSAFFKLYYLCPLEQCVELMQSFPYASSGPHAQPGGMVDAMLEMVTSAVRISKRYMLPPGASPELQAEQSSVWNGVVFYSALMKSLTPLCHLIVELENGQYWSPLEGPLKEPYRFRFKSELSRERERALTAILACRILPPEVITWLNSCPDALESLAMHLLGLEADSNILDSIVLEAGSVACHHNKPPSSVQIEDSLLSDSTSALNEQNVSFSDSEQKLTKNLGELFWEWLIHGCRNNTVGINKPSGYVHLVAGFVFIRSPHIFHHFLAEQGLQPELKGALQKAFEKLGVHRNDRGSMFTCQLYQDSTKQGRYIKLNGYLIVIKKIYGDFSSGEDNANIKLQ